MKTSKGIILILLTWGVCISSNLLMSRVEIEGEVHFWIRPANLIGTGVFIVSWILISIFCSKNKKMTIILMAIDLAGALFGLLCMLNRTFDLSYRLNYPYAIVFNGFESYIPFPFHYLFQTLVMVGFSVVTLLSYFWHKRNPEKVRRRGKKKKRAMIAGIALLICVWDILILWPKSDEAYIEEIFGISKVQYDYDLIYANNNLQRFEYRGTFIAVIDVTEEKTEMLFADNASIKCYGGGVARTIKNLVERYELNEWIDPEKIQDDTGFRQTVEGSIRKIRFYPTTPLSPHQSGTYMGFCEPTDGVYRWFLYYGE